MPEPENVRQRPRPPTIYQVAELAGVSHQTVSRYLRASGRLKPATQAKVEAAIEKLDYRPSSIARSMRTRRSGVLAVVMPAQAAALPSPTLAGAASAAHAAGYTMETSVVEGTSEDRKLRVLELLNSGRVEGVLSLTALPELPQVDRDSFQAALMVVEQFDDELRNVGSLADASVMAEIVHTLATWGHTKFLHVEGPQDWVSARSRKRVFEETVDKLGLSAEQSRGGGWGPEVGYQAIHSLPDSSGVTAVVAANDYIALGAIRAAHERGWTVPGDLNITGWDDLGTVRYGTPALTTVAVDRDGQGRYAMNRLISLLQDEPQGMVEPQANRLVLRETTGPAPTSRMSD